MKTLTLLGCTTSLLAALSGCGTDPIVLGELLAADDDSSGPPQGDEPYPEPDEPEPGEPEPGEPEPDEPEPGAPESPNPIEDEVVDILRVYCGNCHIGFGSAGFDYVHDIDRMIETGFIVPGSKEDSPIYARMANQSMPPLSVESRPTQDQIELVGFFIDQLE